MSAPEIPYLDYAATTPVDPRVIEAMLVCLGKDGVFGNPASVHRHGRLAAQQVETAREAVAALFNALPREVVFTSGATESNNLAIKGLAAHHPGGHLVVSAIEHHAVLDPCDWLEQQGHTVTRVAPEPDGRIDPEKVQAALRAETFLVSIMHANNETGVVNDIAAMAALCQQHGAVFHVDAAQSAGKRPLDWRSVPIDLLSLSGHKMYGPKGIGALLVRRRPGLLLAAQLHGGGQERGWRAGTLPTHQIVGLGKACAIAGEEWEADAQHMAGLRDQLEQGLLALGGVQVNGSAERLPGHSNLHFSGVDGEILQTALSGIAVSAGSACQSASASPSHVLRAMGLSGEQARASLRFSLGRFTTQADIEQAIAHVSEIVRRLRN